MIAAVHGPRSASRLGLALRADVILAAEAACFGHPGQTPGTVTLLGESTE
ncbi:hypothetical protein R6V09_02445 [Streptomyces sp. W16]|nr:hypothetical protein [Streptomyces sp. W16]MDV9168999.1 hypothetical protein [Streptomyces sp. W16]